MLTINLLFAYLCDTPVNGELNAKIEANRLWDGLPQIREKTLN